MTRVKLVEQNGIVRVVAMSEHAVEKSCQSWQEAMEYCDERKYTVDNMDVALERLMETSSIPGDGPDEKPEGGEHTTSFPAGDGVPGEGNGSV